MDVLRHYLKKPAQKSECQIGNCALRKSSPLCLRKMVVYEITCVCGANYIGSTKRPLHTRYKEHLKNSTSAIYGHRLECTGELSVKILSTGKDSVDIGIKEAMLIAERNPTLNRRDEGANILSIVSDNQI